MDLRIIGSILIAVGLLIAGIYGRTMGDLFEAIMYASGFIIAFIGLGFWLKWYKNHKSLES